jgi:hypothetical protein
MDDSQRNLVTIKVKMIFCSFCTTMTSFSKSSHALLVFWGNFWGIWEFGGIGIFWGFLFIKTASPDNDLSDRVRIAIGRWSPILKVTALLFGAVPGDPDGTTAIGHSGRKVMN